MSSYTISYVTHVYRNMNTSSTKFTVLGIPAGISQLVIRAEVASATTSHASASWIPSAASATERQTRDHQRPRLVAHLCTVDNATDPWRRASTVSSPTSTSHDEPAGRKGLRTTLPPHNVQSRVALGASRDAPWAGVTQRSGVKFRNLAPSLDVGRSLCDRSCVPSSKGNGHGRPDEGRTRRFP